jgi:cytochrome oxidase Cu insertion factor (SCO1/SenC/PrrC family)
MNDNTNIDHHDSSPQVSSGSALPYVLAIAIFIAAGFGAFKWWQVEQFEASRGEAITLAAAGPPLTDFELSERSGKPFRSADMQGKVWVASYFFATCPGSCIRLNQNIKFMHNLPELKDVTWLSITCDPDTDTIEELQKYAKVWDADPERWLFGRADLDYIKRVGRGMNLDVYRKGHKDYLVVFDKAGKLRGMYDGTSKSQCERLHTRLLECLAEEPPSDLAATKDQPDAGAAENNST